MTKIENPSKAGQRLLVKRSIVWFDLKFDWSSEKCFCHSKSVFVEFPYYPESQEWKWLAICVPESTADRAWKLLPILYNWNKNFCLCWLLFSPFKRSFNFLTEQAVWLQGNLFIMLETARQYPSPSCPKFRPTYLLCFLAFFSLLSSLLFTRCTTTTTSQHTTFYYYQMGGDHFGQRRKIQKAENEK